EGAVFVTGAAIQWLRDGLGIIAGAAETGPLAASVPDSDGVFLVPAFTGMGSPYWDPHARGALLGLTKTVGRAHLARAAVEAMAHQTRDVVEAMQAVGGTAISELRADGGAAVMDFLCQFQADLLGVPVRRPRVAETTALGATYLAGLAEGVWSSPEELGGYWLLEAEFTPKMGARDAERRQEAWRRAVERVGVGVGGGGGVVGGGVGGVGCGPVSAPPKPLSRRGDRSAPSFFGRSAPSFFGRSAPPSVGPPPSSVLCPGPSSFVFRRGRSGARSGRCIPGRRGAGWRSSPCRSWLAGPAGPSVGPPRR